MNSLLRDTIVRFRHVPIVVVQLLLIGISYVAAFWLRFDGQIPEQYRQSLIQTLPWLLAIRGLTFIPFRLYQGLWKYAGIYDLQVLLSGIGASTAIFVVYVLSPWGPEQFPRSVLVTDALLATMLLGGVRMSRRLYVGFMGVRPSGRRVLIYGAGDAGQMIVREVKGSPGMGLRPVGFIDDDPAKLGRRIHGVRVLGSRKDLARVIDDTDPTELLLAMPQLEPVALRTIARELAEFDLPIKTLPNLRDLIDGKVGVATIRSLALEDLLARAPIGLNQASLRALIEGQRVMVTGAGGSIGSELCRQIMTLRPACLIMLERYENSLHAIRLELDDPAAVPVIGDVTDQNLLQSVFATHRPRIVFHAAAHKHVTLMEENPCEAIKNNVRGTRLLSAAAEAAGVDRFILISTDKAANPTSIMGASKRVAEMVVQARAQGSGTSFSIVRFGNVLGSNGSVVPRFVEQIRAGGPVTVTHPDVRRFFMVIPEAVQLVLHAAAQASRSGTYVLDMGEQIKVADVARNLIRLSGLVPDEDIAIVYTGLRPGEKMEEELYGDHEELRPSSVQKVFVVKSAHPTSDTFWATVNAIEDAAANGDQASTIAQLRALVGGGVGVAPQKTRSGELVGHVPQVTEVHQRHHQQCPRCKHAIHRSRSRRADQKLRKRLTSKRLYRCSSCGWRGWVVPMDVVVQPAEASVLPPPDLSALDGDGSAIPPRTGFVPRDLS